MANEFIQLLIMDEYQKLKFVELSNWDGVAYLGSRKHIPLMQKIEQLRNPGIYFLLGENVETGKKILYIGESENVANRFQRAGSRMESLWKGIKECSGISGKYFAAEKSEGIFT